MVMKDKFITYMPMSKVFGLSAVRISEIRNITCDTYRGANRTWINLQGGSYNYTIEPVEDLVARINKVMGDDDCRVSGKELVGVIDRSEDRKG
jgi:hypothetical protein